LEPAYMAAYREDRLSSRLERAQRLMSCCGLCARRCKVDRNAGQLGFCGTSGRARVSSFGLHFGEESPLVGQRGSGTVFFSHCNLGCIFCQNHEISHRGEGKEVDSGELAAIFLNIQNQGAHNLNLVTPSHVMPMILEALIPAVERGFELPLVWNCGGYESIEALELLDGIVDIYMPDFKFWDEKQAALLSQAPDYPAAAREAIREMHRQVGDLEIDSAGVARRGLLIRHLVLPDEAAGSRPFFAWLASTISPSTYLNLMDQYRPCFKASQVPRINRRLTSEEFLRSLNDARAAGLCRLDRDLPRRRLPRPGKG